VATINVHMTSGIPQPRAILRLAVEIVGHYTQGTGACHVPDNRQPNDKHDLDYPVD
jgi:hypothetical protein